MAFIPTRNHFSDIVVSKTALAFDGCSCLLTGIVNSLPFRGGSDDIRSFG
jgi:hypothetical protein